MRRRHFGAGEGAGPEGGRVLTLTASLLPTPPLPVQRERPHLNDLSMSTSPGKPFLPLPCQSVDTTLARTRPQALLP